MSDLATIRGKVSGIVRDNSGKLVNPTDYDRNINAAIARYSKHCPGIKVLDITGNGGHDYSISLLTGWNDDFSTVKSIEYPIDEIPAEYLEAEGYEVFEKPTGKVLRLNADSPPVTEKFRVTVTILRTDATIPASDEDALCNLAASLCLEELANAYTQTSDSTIAADSVNHRSKGSEFASRAKALMQLYKQHMGINEDDTTPAASAVADLDLKYPGGAERLTHPRKRREQR